jgi:hypothetical protein
MKNILRISLLLALVVWSCSNEELEVIEQEAQTTTKAQPVKITICHFEAIEDTWKQMSVHPNALESHLAHGDIYGEYCPDYRLDDDNDGVSNDIDQCQNTPIDEIANEEGCSPSQISDNLLQNPSAEEGESYWLFNGQAGVEEYELGNNVFYTIQDLNNVKITQEVNFGLNNYNKYVLLIANTHVDLVHEGSITGRPYLWGQQINSSTGLTEFYMQNMISFADANTWQIISGIFQIRQNVDKIHLQLSQGSQVGDDPFGAKALYDDIEIIIFDTEAEAINYRDNIYNP